MSLYALTCLEMFGWVGIGIGGKMCVSACMCLHVCDAMSVMVIDGLTKCDPTLRKIRESHWIRTLATASPQGMNLRVDIA